MRKLLILSLLLSSPAYASEVTLVKSDNTVIKTIHHYGNSQLEVETEPIPASGSFGTAECFDRAKKLPTRQARMKAIEDCLTSDNTIAIGGLG